MNKDTDNRTTEDFVNQELPEIIKHLEAKSPEAERFLLEIAKLAGLKQAVLFDGTIVDLDGADGEIKTEPSNN